MQIKIILNKFTWVFGVVVEGGRVVTVPVVGGVVVVVLGDDNTGFQILKNQNEGSVMGADSGPQNSVPLATPIYHRKKCK